MTTPFAELEARLRRWPGYMGSAPTERGLQIMWQGGFHIPGLPNFTSDGGKTIPVNVLVVGTKGYENDRALLARLKKVSGFLGGGMILRWFKPEFEIRWLPDHGIPPLPAGTRVRVVEQVQEFKGALVGLGLGAVALAGGLALAMSGPEIVLLGGPRKRQRLLGAGPRRRKGVFIDFDPGWHDRGLWLDEDQVARGGWTIKAQNKIHGCEPIWGPSFSKFEARHPKYGVVLGDLEESVYATSKAGYNHFSRYYKPRTWDPQDC